MVKTGNSNIKSKSKNNNNNNKKKYLYVNKQDMKQIGFRYDNELEDYIYEFPVYRHNNKATITCKLGITDNVIYYRVYSNGILCRLFYNSDCCISELKPIIQENINKEIKRLQLKYNKNKTKNKT